MSRILDPDFRYVDAASTDVRDTFRRFGFKATTDAERRARRKPKPEPVAENVRPIRQKRKEKAA